MLTISELAAYAGVTVRAVRHYHQVGLLPEPLRDSSGYRSYGGADVVRLIRIRTLAEAGVPLARVQDLLDADGEDFAAAVREIDQRLRDQVRALQEHRRRIARLAAGDSLALPPEVVDYLARLRATGVSDEMVEGERDGWILLAARWPDRIPELMADKTARLEDPQTVKLYLLLDEVVHGELDEERLARAADLLADLAEQSAARGEMEMRDEPGDDDFVALMDSFATSSHPAVARLQELMVERGWQGWTRIERTPG